MDDELKKIVTKRAEFDRLIGTVAEKRVQVTEAELELKAFIRNRFVAVYPILKRLEPDSFPWDIGEESFSGSRYDFYASVREDDVNVTIVEYFRGETLEERVRIPANLFFAEEDIEEIYKKMALEKEEERERMREQNKKRDEEQERAYYERLKKKYGD